jgi:uncharacterized protein
MSGLIVLDTNVLISGLLSERGAPGLLLDLIFGGELDLVADERILAEYREVSARPELRLDPVRAGEVINFIENSARIITAPPWPLPLPDAEDGMFLAAARAAGAPLVTGNLRHFPEKARAGVAVLSPGAFLDSDKLAGVRRLARRGYAVHQGGIPSNWPTAC